MLPGYTFDPRLPGGGRYRSLATGRTVARARILELLDAQVNLRADRLARLTMDFTASRIGAQGWVETMRNELRRAHLQNSSLGIGGWERMGPKQWGRIGYALREDYRRLAAFAEEIASGKLSEAQILNRLNMYLGNARVHIETVEELGL